MIFETRHLRVPAYHFYFPLFLPLVIIYTPSNCIADQLLPAFFKGKQQTALPLLRPTRHKLGGHKCFSGSSGTGDQNNTVAKEPTPAHRIDLLVSRGDPKIR